MDSRKETSVKRALVDSVVATLIVTPVFCSVSVIATRFAPPDTEAGNVFYLLAPISGLAFFFVSLARSLFLSSLPTFAGFTKPLPLLAIIILNLGTGTLWFIGGRDVSGKQTARDEIRDAFTTQEEWDRTKQEVLYPVGSRPETPGLLKDLKNRVEWESVRASTCLDHAVVEIGRAAYEAARDTLISCLKCDTLSEPTRDSILFYLGLAYFRLGKWGSANSTFDSVFKRGGWAKSEVYLNKALIALELDSVDKAISFMEDIANESQGSICLDFYRGVFYFERRELGEAKNRFELARENCVARRKYAELYLSMIESTPD